MSRVERFTSGEDATGERLDVYLARRFDVPRNRAQGWIRDGAVTVNGAAAKPSLKLQGGETISCEPQPVTQEGTMEPEPGELSLLYEDSALVVVDKPAGLVVHPGAGRDRGTLAHRLLARYPEMAGVGGPGRPGIVHRLDRDTTGVLVAARTPAAYQALSRAFAERRVEKRYLAVVYGAPSPASGTLDQPIGRHPGDRKRMTVTPRGRPATTGYSTRATAAGISLVELDLETGRTHQIRVHLKAHRCPLVGDPVYGEARWRGLPGAVASILRRFPRPALHAWRIALPHPATGERIACEAPVPADLVELWRRATGGPWPPP
ncbi:MAG: RluA family pseudouridine synthase [Thermoanaerobaculia bacterium]|nr:RluA family pseudouridine synthase [Thermoanaerobaculia bacterium]